MDLLVELFFEIFPAKTPSNNLKKEAEDPAAKEKPKKKVIEMTAEELVTKYNLK